jgi:hypothetical protein
MNIIFGDAIKNIPDSFTVLELDTIRVEDSDVTQKAWAVVENIPLHEFSTLADYRSAHENLMIEYRQQNWEYCMSAIRSLTGRWNGELDSFYQHLSQRIQDYRENPPGPGWDGTIFRKSTNATSVVDPAVQDDA